MTIIRLAIFLLSFSFPFWLPAQAGCYSAFYQRGKQLYDEGKYETARYQFYAALECDDKPKTEDVKEWIEKCYQGDAAKLRQKVVEAQARALTAKAWRLYPQDNTLALNMAIEAYKSDPNPESAYAISSFTGNPNSAFYQKNIQAHDETVASIAFSPNGKYILSGGWDGKARLWSREGDLLLNLDIGATVVSAVAFSHDGRFLLAGSGDGSISLHSFSGEKVRSIAGHTDRISSLAFSPDGQHILSGSWDKTARLWTIDGQPVRSFSHPFVVYAAAFEADSDRILTTAAGGGLNAWSINGDLITAFQGSGNGIRAIAQAGATLICGDQDGYAYRLNGQSMDQAERSWRLDGEVSAAGYLPETDFMLFGALGKGIIRVFAENGNEVKSLWLNQQKGPETEISALAFSPDGKLAASGDRKGSLKIWLIENEEMHTFRGHQGGVNSVAFSSEGQYVATSSWDRTARVWSRDGDLLLTVKAPENSVNTLSFPDDNRIRVEPKDDFGVVIGAGAKQKKKSIQQVFTSVTFTPEGHLATECSDTTTIVWSLKGEKIRSFRTPPRKSSTVGLVENLPWNKDEILAAAASPDGRYILTGHSDGVAILWTADGQEVQTFQGHQSYVPFDAFSKDGSIDITEMVLGKQTPIRIDGQLPDLSLARTAVSAVAFSPDGKYILTGSTDGTAKLWPRWDVMLETGRMARPTEEERKGYGWE